MHPHLVIIAGISIPLYNLMIGVGAIFGFLVLDNELKKRDISYSLELKYYISLIIAGILGFLGAKIFDLITQSLPITIMNIYYGGFTFLGGISTAIVILFILSKIFKFSIYEFFNLLSPSLAIAHSFGRVGCFFAGCCYGKPTGTSFGVVFPPNSLPAMELNNVFSPIHPTQLYEVFLEFVIFIILIKPVKFNFRFPVYIILYGTGRFFIEFLRGDNRGKLIFNSLSPSQSISILMVITGIIIILFTKEVKITKQRGKSDNISGKKGTGGVFV